MDTTKKTATVATLALAVTMGALAYFGGLQALMLPYTGLKHVVMGLKWPMTYLETWGFLKVGYLKGAVLVLTTLAYYFLVLFTLYTVYVAVTK